MKFLHLADLHIGKSVNGFSMLEEQRNIFTQIINYIKIKKPQAVLIAGDIYDRTVPGVEAVRLFDDFLTELADLNIIIMAIAGNHDSSERLNYAGRLLAGKNVYFGAGSVKLSDEYGEINFLRVPFVRITDNCMNCIKPFEFFEFPEIDYNSRNVIIAHQFFSSGGVSPLLSDSEINSADGLDAVDVQVLDGFDYAALGHLHTAQHILSENIRYAGSPLQYSFSESAVNHKKSVPLVELREKNNINIELLPLEPVHTMREIRGTLDGLVNSEPTFDYLRVILTDKDVNEMIDPMGKIRAVYPNVMTLEFENLRTSFDFAGLRENARDIEKLSPFELFGEFFLESHGFAMSEAQVQIVQEILRNDEILKED